MAVRDQQLAGELPKFSRDDWISLVKKSLRGSQFDEALVSSTYDGLTIKPLYTVEDDLGADHAGFPADAPLTRGRHNTLLDPPWDVRQLYAEPDIADANQAIHDDLSHGVTSVLLRIAAPEQSGINLQTADDLKRILQGIDIPSVPIALQAGVRAIEVAETLLSVWNEHNSSADHRQSALNVDPIGTLARCGGLPINLDQAFTALARLFEQTEDRSGKVSILLADGRPYHNAGATEAQEIAGVAATLVAYLHALDGRGLSPQKVLERSTIMLAADADQFLTIAKFRAARHVVWRIADACGAGDAARLIPLAAQTSERMMAGRDVHVNMLRTTVACAGAILGGADAITVLPYTWPLGLPDAFARRIARNTHSILRDEAAVGRVLDPAGGSWYLEKLTESLAQEAWETFQRIEAGGGLVTFLQEGHLQSVIRKAGESRERDIATSSLELTGVSAFPDISEVPVMARPFSHPEELDDPAITVEPMPLRRVSESFEKLRDAADAHATANGARPHIFFATLGLFSDFNERASDAKNFFAAGGIEASAAQPFESADAVADHFAASEAKIACLCSSDEIYQEMALETARALKAKGAQHIYLVGRAGDRRQDYKDAGVDTFVHKGCDMLNILKRAHDILDVAAHYS